MINRRICLLGGTGFVGAHLATRLANDGWRVRLLTRNASLHRELKVIPTVQIVQGDVHNPVFLRQQTAGCAAVVNLVGILNESGRDGSGFERAHVELTGKVIAACQENGVRRLLHMSALKANANAPSHYLRTKAEAESLVRRGQNIDSTIFQPSIIFGPDDNFVNRFATMLRIPSYFFALPRASARFQPVFVGDVVEAFVGVIDNPKTFGKTYQLGGKDVYSLRELIYLIARSLGLKRQVIGLPDGLSAVLAFLMDFVPTKPFSTDNFKSLQIHSICDNNGFDALGIKPRSSANMIPHLLAGAAGRQRIADFQRRQTT